MDVRTYLRAIRKSWWLIVLVVVLGGVGAAAYSSTATPVYQAQVQFTVGVSQSGAIANAESNTLFAQDTAVTLAKLLSSDLVARRVIADSGVHRTPTQLTHMIGGSAEINTTVIDATVLDTDRARLRTVARALAKTFPAMASVVQPDATNSAQISIQVTSGPMVGSSPVSPRTKLNIVIGVVAGLIVGLLIAVLRLLRDTSVRTRDDVEAIAGAPLIGDIGFDKGARTAPLVLDEHAHSVRAEAFRQLRTNLQFVDAAQALRVVLVTSSTEAEGKSTTATNLALSFAEAGRRVVLVGADLRRPRVADYLGLERAIGLTNVLVGQVPLDEAVQRFGDDGLYLLASGSVPPNPSELLGSTHMADLLAQLRDRFDLVVIDTPPLLPVTDAAVLSVHADGVVVVCRHGRTRRVQLATAMRSLRAVNARVVGAVLTMRPARGPDAESYGTYAYYDDPAHGHRLVTRLRRRFSRRSEPAHSTAALPELSSAAADRAVEDVRRPDPVAEPRREPAWADLGEPPEPATAATPLSATARNAYGRRRARSSALARRRVADADGIRADADEATMSLDGFDVLIEGERTPAGRG